MADVITGRFAVLDIVGVLTKRSVLPSGMSSWKIKAIVLDGETPSSVAGSLALKENSTGGTVIWQYTVGASNTYIHDQEHFDGAIRGNEGLYLAAPASDGDISAAWQAGAKLIIYFA